jgi:hypothetical protein
MNYKLAKTLKDAGFPQKDRGNILIHKKAEPKYGRPERWVPAYTKNTKENGLPNTMWLYVPTLSELIEACGESFRQLTRDLDSHKWVASDNVFYDDAGIQEISESGATPEEAVANLWLALTTPPADTTN